MPRLVFSSEKHGRGATIELNSNETVVCSIAQMGVLVYLYDNKHGLIRGILSDIWGARLYNQKDVYKNAQTAQALHLLYPYQAPELQHLRNPALAVFANAIWHCGSAAEVCTVLNEAAGKLPDLERAASDACIQEAIESAKNYQPKRPPERMAATYQVVYSDGVTQQTELLPVELEKWVMASNKAEADKPYRIVRVMDSQGHIVWGR